MYAATSLFILKVISTLPDDICVEGIAQILLCTKGFLYSKRDRGPYSNDSLLEAGGRVVGSKVRPPACLPACPHASLSA